MASSAIKADSLPEEIAEVLDEAMAREMHLLVVEAPGCRCYQDYLCHASYQLATVGFMRKVRYTPGNWPTAAFGSVLPYGTCRNTRSGVTMSSANWSYYLAGVSFGTTVAQHIVNPRLNLNNDILARADPCRPAG